MKPDQHLRIRMKNFAAFKAKFEVSLVGVHVLGAPILTISFSK